MRYRVIFAPSAHLDLKYYEARQQRIIIVGIANYLSEDAHIEDRRRKRLRPNNLAPWELRIAEFRVFYGLDEAGTITIVAIGHKEHSELFVRGRRVDL
jgi:mRNA-degrading endonuclease RelE of RelBE toxin-antitoxin system